MTDGIAFHFQTPWCEARGTNPPVTTRMLWDQLAGHVDAFEAHGLCDHMIGSTTSDDHTGLMFSSLNPFDSPDLLCPLRLY